MPEHFRCGCKIFYIGDSMKTRILLALTAAILLAAGCSGPQKTWMTDYDEAKALSEKKGKDLLVVFTGSDWDLPSQDLIAAGFTKPFFAKASKTYVLCNQDIIQDPEKIDEAVRDKLYQVLAKFGIQSLPSFVLMTPEGDVYVIGDFPAELKSPEEVVEYLAQFKENRDKLVSAKALINSSTGVDKVRNIDTFMTLLSPFQRENYESYIREVPELDPANETGLLGKYSLQNAYLVAIEKYQQGDLVAAAETFKALIDTNILDGAQTQEAWFYTAYLYSMSETVPDTQIIAWLEKAIAADPENPGVTQIRGAIEQIKSNSTSK